VTSNPSKSHENFVTMSYHISFPEIQLTSRTHCLKNTSPAIFDRGHELSRLLRGSVDSLEADRVSPSPIKNSRPPSAPDLQASGLQVSTVRSVLLHPGKSRKNSTSAGCSRIGKKALSCSWHASQVLSALKCACA
jgi:hypothetical protein